MKLSTRLVGLSAVLALAPQSLDAQFDAVTALFKEVHSITLYGQGAYLNNAAVRGGDRCLVDEFLCGIGSEVLIDVGPEGGAHVELGLGASYLSGVEAKASNLELNGAIRSFPTISAYVTDLRIKRVPGEYYVGGGIGLAEFMNAQAYDSTGIERDVKGSTFELGATAGTYGALGNGMGAFFEISWRWRRFSSLDYTLVDADSGRVPTNWPRELHFGGPSFAMGLQFRLKQDPPKPTVQAWTLASVNAQALPAVVDATPSGEYVKQTQVVFGSLTLRSTDKTYVLQVVSRPVHVNADGTVRLLETPVVREESGTYSMTGPQLTLDPVRPVDRAPTVYTITELGDELVIRDSQNGYVLTFRKPGSQSPSAKSDSKTEDDVL